MKPIILITRPQDGADDTVAWVEKLGFRAMSAPVLEIKPVPVTLPDPTGYQGLIFSSAHGVQEFARLDPGPRFLQKPVFAVGEQTAEAASAARFTDVRQAVGAGTMKNLMAMVRRQMAPPARLLHLRGRDVRDNPSALLPVSQGWEVRGITLYAADPVEALDVSARQAFAEGEVGAVLFYSARSAETFTALSAGLDLTEVKALCLADSVVESLNRDQWAAIRVASRPDRAGMMSLVTALKSETLMPMPIFSSANDDADALINAEIVIERFGGIRPMANKMSVPVTTVQGWKKRNIIPGNRRDDVLSAAFEHNIDLSDLVANENDFSSTLEFARREEAGDPEIDRIHQKAILDAPEAAPASAAGMGVGMWITKEEMMREIRKAQLATIRKSVGASAGLILVFAMFAGLAVAIGQHQVEKTEDRVAVLEQQAPMAAGAPTPYARMMDAMKVRLDGVEANVSGLKTQVETIIPQRLGTIDQAIQALTGANPNLAGLAGKLQTPQGVGAAGPELTALFLKMQGRMDGIESALAEQQKSSTALGQALQGVSPKELKAAAMLIGLNQFRDSLNRHEPFADDLAMLQRMTGDQDPELNAAIEKLAPYAAQGVLSPSGLSQELKGLTGDIIVSSVNGDNASIQDKAIARFQKLVSVEKDGQPVIGNQSQAVVAKAQTMLDAGDVDGAVAQLQTLKGPALVTAQPVINQGQITMMAQQVQSMLSRTILSDLKNIGKTTTRVTASPALGPIMLPSESVPAPAHAPAPIPPKPAMGSFKALNNQPAQTP